LVVWAFGGRWSDKSGKVVIDSPETIKALGTEGLNGTFAPGTLSCSTRATTRRSSTGRSR